MEHEKQLTVLLEHKSIVWHGKQKMSHIHHQIQHPLTDFPFSRMDCVACQLIC
jgi:hypothetical protein